MSAVLRVNDCSNAVDIDVPIGCGAVPVYPGDIIVGDGDGVVVVPTSIADQIAEEARAMDEFEQWAMEKVRDGRSITGLYPPDERTSEEYRNRKS